MTTYDIMPVSLMDILDDDSDEAEDSDTEAEDDSTLILEYNKVKKECNNTMEWHIPYNKIHVANSNNDR